MRYMVYIVNHRQNTDCLLVVINSLSYIHDGLYISAGTGLYL